MAKRRRRRMTAKQLKYFGKKKRHHRRRKATHVAKRRHRRSHRRHTRRVHRRRSSGGGGGLLPDRETMYLMGGAALIGFLEGKAKADANFILNKIPRPIKQLGYTGGTALALYVAGKFTHNRYIKIAARSAAILTAYQFASKNGAPGEAILSLSGWDEISGGEEHILDVGALSSEGEAMEGIPFDDRVDLPMA